MCISNRGVAGVSGVLWLHSDSPDHKISLRGALDPGHPHGGGLRQGSFLIPKGYVGALNLSAELELRPGVLRRIAWECEQPLNPDGSITIELKDTNDRERRRACDVSSISNENQLRSGISSSMISRCQWLLLRATLVPTMGCPASYKPPAAHKSLRMSATATLRSNSPWLIHSKTTATAHRAAGFVLKQVPQKLVVDFMMELDFLCLDEGTKKSRTAIRRGLLQIRVAPLHILSENR